jgi:hypothetical protein
VPLTPETLDLPLRRRATFRTPKSRPETTVEPIVVDTVAEPVAAEPAAAERAADAPSASTRTSRMPRHRAEPVRNRRPLGDSFRRTVALGCTAAILGVSALAAVAAAGRDEASADTAASAASSTTRAATGAADTLAATAATAATAAEVDAGPTVTSDLSVAAAPFTGGTQVTVTGESLDEVAAVSVGGAPAPIVAADERQVTFAVPAATETALGTAAPVELTDVAGGPVDVVQPTAVVAEGTSVVQPLEGVLTGLPQAPAPTAPRSLALTYTSDPAIDAQRDYVLSYWSEYNSAQYPVISGYDCANFASQSLIARGWAMDAGWYLDLNTGAMSPSWASSTALRDYLASRTDRATALDDAQRDLVKVGDIAQFDWDDSGDRDHTAIVTRVEHTDAGTKVWVGGHTKDADYWDVDTALATGGGTVSYFSIS